MHLQKRLLLKYLGACLVAVCLAAGAPFSLARAEAPEKSAPRQEPLPAKSSLTLTGSMALADLVGAWAEPFARRFPAIALTLADPGGAAGIGALIDGTADAVLVSTPMDRRRQWAFESRFSYPPRMIPVARDGVAVYVNTLNPLKSITLGQLDAIFSVSRLCGGKKAVRTWGDLGIGGGLKTRRISFSGLDAATGAYDLFKAVALCGGDFAPDFQALVGPAEVETALATDPAGIAFSGSALRSAGIRALAIAVKPGSPPVAPTAAAIRTGRYPLPRTLSIAVNVPPGRELPGALKSFIDFVLSPEGQTIARKAGYVPLPARPDK